MNDLCHFELFFLLTELLLSVCEFLPQNFLLEIQVHKHLEVLRLFVRLFLLDYLFYLTLFGDLIFQLRFLPYGFLNCLLENRLLLSSELLDFTLLLLKDLGLYRRQTLLLELFGFK